MSQEDDGAAEPGPAAAPSVLPESAAVPRQPTDPGDPSGAEGAASAPPEAPKDPAERVGLAEELRDAGNLKFRDKDFKGAKKDYQKSLTLLRLEGGDGGDLAAKAKACRVLSLLNLALCCLRAEPSEAFQALECCEEVLEIEPDNAKAVYRKGKALLELGEVKEAEWELVRACKLMPKDGTVRKDLDLLRQRVRESKEKEKATYEGLFERDPGFASDQRQQGSGPTAAGLSQKDVNDIYFHDQEENPYEASEHPHLQAQELQGSGQLSDAVMAWEAAVSQSAASKDWAAHYGYLVEFGRLFMDLNLDSLALRCFNKVFEPPGSDEGDGAGSPPPAERRHALLLRAICLLNEAEGDPEAEISACLADWMGCACDPDPSSPSDAPLVAQISRWRESKGAQASADSAVALGLLHLLQGSEAAPLTFASALCAPEDDGSCFGNARGLAARWNMLGAVLANRKRYDHALVAYEQALALQAHYPRACINSGIAHAAVGEDLKAAASYAEAVNVVPSWSAQAIWPLLEKVCNDQSSVDDLAEAARAKNLVKVRELLADAPVPCAAPGRTAAVEVEPAADVLARLGLQV